jgi:hypothetical protein
MDYDILLELINPTLPNGIQFYGLVFLIGSLTVASLSDLKRMAAQREFAEVWLLFTLCFFGYDLYHSYQEASNITFIAKWAMIAIFAIFSWKYFGIILSLSEMDLTASFAVMSLLSPIFILGFYLLLIAFKTILTPILKKFGDGLSMPFLPVILTATTTLIIMIKIAETIIK